MKAWKWPGNLALLCLIALLITTLGSLFYFSKSEATVSILSDPLLHKVIGFTLYQALLSTLFSVGPGILIGYALFRRQFPLKSLLLKILSMTLILPSLVVVFGIITIYGRNGLVLSMIKAAGLHSLEFSLYGLSGILLAHIFFNLPFAALLILKALQSIPSAQRQLAAQLNFSVADTVLLIEWPVLKKQILSVSVLIFTLCFSSFSVVLTLGGGPKATTIELAIYQALTYEYDFTRAAFLAIIQITLCLVLLIISQRVKNSSIKASTSELWQTPFRSKLLFVFDYSLILLVILLVLPPILSIIISGINPDFWQTLVSQQLLSALANSLIIGFLAALIAMILANSLIWTARQYQFNHSPMLANFYITSGSFALAMPSLVIATGLYLILFHLKLDKSQLASPYILVSAINGLMALPFVINLIYPYLTNTGQVYQQLCAIHSIKGIHRWWYIDVQANLTHFKKAFAFALTLSLGDIGVMAFLGTQHAGSQFITLPYLLFLQLGTYQSAKADATAFVLLMLALGLFFIIDRSKHHR